MSRRPADSELYPFIVADAAFAAAWAALEYWAVEDSFKSRLLVHLQDTAQFLDTLKPQRPDFGISDLRERLLRISPVGPERIEVWAYLLAHWVEKSCAFASLSARHELVDRGWALASFGLGFWRKEPLYYRENDQIQKLVVPYSRSDAFELLGPFEQLEEKKSRPAGERLIFGSLAATKGLRTPGIWSQEARLGGARGVSATRTGFVHRQFAGLDLPEWFDAVEITYDPHAVDLNALLCDFWGHYHNQGDLLFYTEPHQEALCRRAWEKFTRQQPGWALERPLQLHPGKWFEPAPPERQKLALRQRPVLLNLLRRVKLVDSPLAGKLNAFAGGYGSDQDVVMLAASYGMSDGLTLALRAIRYFSRKLHDST